MSLLSTCGKGPFDVRDKIWTRFEYWWSPTFIDEMMMVKPRRILALGNPVYQVFRRKLQLEQLHKVMQVKHPRYYASHGALSHRLTKSFLDMTLEYRLAMA